MPEFYPVIAVPGLAPIVKALSGELLTAVQATAFRAAVNTQIVAALQAEGMVKQ